MLPNLSRFKIVSKSNLVVEVSIHNSEYQEYQLLYDDLDSSLHHRHETQ
jgi:hypothetical protein